MGPRRSEDSWLEDFSILLRPDAIRSMRRKPEFDVFTGSKVSAGLWIAAVAALAGAVGGMLAGPELLTRVWPTFVGLLVVGPALWVAIDRSTRAVFGAQIAYLTGWSIFFGSLVAALSIWSAQLSSAGWAYGVAAGVGFFLLGITGAGIDPPNAGKNESWFLTSSVACPIANCAAVWVYRNCFSEPHALLHSAGVGVIAATPFMAATMALYLKAWNVQEGLDRLAALYLHNDRFLDTAIRLLDVGLRNSPGDAGMYDRRALASALSDKPDIAESDWARHRELAPEGVQWLVSQGWLHLRRERPSEAETAFEEATKRSKKERWAIAGLGLARLRLGDAGGAVEAFERLQGKTIVNGSPTDGHDALSLTCLAEAQLALGEPELAIATATNAIEEFNSVHGRTWLARADAHVRLGDIDAAAKDYKSALRADDEIGVEDRALAGLEVINRSITQEKPRGR
jgi:tetratricopeptide (TPR) repeat protein